MELNIESIKLYKDIGNTITNKAEKIIEEYGGKEYCLENVDVRGSVYIYYDVDHCGYNTKYMRFSFEDFINLSTKQLADIEKDKRKKEKIEKEEEERIEHAQYLKLKEKFENS
jgi:hypothetical protein